MVPLPPTAPCLAVALPQPGRLQQVEVRIIDLQNCQTAYRSEPIAKDMLCAGHFQGQKGFCEVSAPASTLCQSTVGLGRVTGPSGPQLTLKYSGGREAGPPLTGNLGEPSPC